jgi:hypothetical protein
MPISEIVKRAKVNGAKGPWEGWWDRMAEKTLLHYMLRLSGIQLSASASTVLDAEWIEVEPAAAAPAARAFAVPAVAPMRQIEAAPTPATPADPVKALRAQRATLIAEIADLSGISGDAVARARAVMRAAGCAEVANPDEAALTTQIDLLTAHLAPRGWAHPGSRSARPARSATTPRPPTQGACARPPRRHDHPGLRRRHPLRPRAHPGPPPSRRRPRPHRRRPRAARAHPGDRRVGAGVAVALAPLWRLR